MKDKFGIELTDREVKMFLSNLGIVKVEHSLNFIIRLMVKFSNEVPFQNFMMLSRGFGVIPTEEHIKDDMLSLKGGTCATINLFIAALLYQLGFDTHLIHGSMQKINDHIAILLKYKDETYTIDLGDGQPYFEPHNIKKDITKSHPFRTYRIINNSTTQVIEFLINGIWSTDVTLDLNPKPFKIIYKTIEEHYTKSSFGPFWKGIRYTFYPNKEIFALRDNIIITSNKNLVERKKISNLTALKVHIEKLNKEHINYLIDNYINLDIL